MDREKKNEKCNDLFLLQAGLSLLLEKTRGKILTAMLKPILDKNLGFSTKTQCYKVIKPTLIDTHIYSESESNTVLICENISDNQLSQVFKVIKSFTEKSTQGKPISFETLYINLSEYDISKEAIPIYIAVELRQHMKNSIILKNNLEIPINAQTLEDTHKNPDKYDLYIEKWDSAKEKYLCELNNIFCDSYELSDSGFNSINRLHNNMYKWLYSLPKYTLVSKTQYVGTNEYVPFSKEILFFKNSLKTMNNDSMNYLFTKLPEIFGEPCVNSNVIDKLKVAKQTLETHIDKLKKVLKQDISLLFSNTANDNLNISLAHWNDSLNDTSKTYSFKNGEEKVLQIINAEKEDMALLHKLSLFVMGIEIENWNENSPVEFILKLNEIKNTIENNKIKSTWGYTLFVTDGNKDIVKKFSKVSYTQQSKLLRNELYTLMAEYGNSINIGEKRQVLLDVLQNL